MDLSIKLLKNVIKAILISLVFISTVSAQNKILATNYLVQDIDTGEIIAEKNSLEVRSIASITKLMTAMVVLDANQDLDEIIKFKRDPGIKSKLPNGLSISRRSLMLLTLMSSDNGAAKTLAKHYPGGEYYAIKAMNDKARSLGMFSSNFTDPTGLYNDNTSTATDLVKLVNHAFQYPDIRNFSTQYTEKIKIPGKKKSQYINFRTTNYLVSADNILLSKTGWITASGGCLVMVVQEQGKRLVIILLNSRNTMTRIRDGLLLTGYENARNQRNSR